jgi:hypothetical protein
LHRYSSLTSARISRPPVVGARPWLRVIRRHRSRNPMIFPWPFALCANLARARAR